MRLIMLTIAEQLHKVIDKLEVEINQDRFCTLIFRVRDWKVEDYEKNYKKKIKEIGIEITD